MNIKSVFTCFLLISFSSVAFGQKIKYKELFVLLNAKQFEQAEPYLKRYLRDNDDNPNAYLYMGLIYQEKTTKLDVLRQTELLSSQIDSAVYFYAKANKGMTEKEVGRNEEYYQMYNRRDLRTGKFGVKLSDVLLDMENRSKIKEKIPILTSLKSQFITSKVYYDRARELFLIIQKTFPGLKEFYLRADDKLMDDLNQLARLYDSAHISFNDYRATSKTYGKTGYNQDIDPREIGDFKKDGDTETDFYKDDLTLWDYKRWAISSSETIEKEIRPLNDQLVAHDREINNLLQKIKKDSVSVRDQLVTVQAKTFPLLLKIDPQPLPVKIFELKLAELVYGSQIVEDRPIRDSLNLLMQIKALRTELQIAKKIDSLGGLLTNRNLTEETENYKHFVATAYGTTAVLSSLIKTTHEFGVREVSRKESELNRKTASLRWIIDGSDSIPLFNEVSAASQFKPILLKEENFATGLHYSDSLPTGYFYTIAPSRKPEVKASYIVDQQVFKKRNLSFTKALHTQDEKGQVYFIVLYSEAKINENYPATMVKIYRTDGLAWSINYAFSQLPEEINFSAETSEFSVKTRNPAGELFAITFDKNGKLIK